MLRCNPGALTGSAEIRMLFILTEQRTVTHPEATDVSGRDDGIPWEPKKLSSKLQGFYGSRTSC